MSIEQSYNTLLPILFSFMEYIIDNFIEYSKNTKNKIQLIIIFNFIFLVTLLIIYYCFFYFTNNHLG